MSAALAMSLAEENPSSTLIARLKSYGITDREIKYLPNIETTPDGIKRLAPSSVTNALVQTKYKGFIYSI